MPEPKWAMGWGSFCFRTLTPVGGVLLGPSIGRGPFFKAPALWMGIGGEGMGWLEGRLEGGGSEERNKEGRKGDAKREEFFFMCMWGEHARAWACIKQVRTCSGQVWGCLASIWWLCCFRAGVSNPKLGVRHQSWFTKNFYFIFVWKLELGCSSGQVCSDLVSTRPALTCWVNPFF